MMTATTDKEYFKEFQRNPLLFMQFQCRTHVERHYGANTVEDVTIEDCFFESTNQKISAFINDKAIVDSATGKYLLVIMDRENVNLNEKSQDTDTVKFTFHIANSQNENDWLVIINSLIIRSQNAEDKYPFMYILWFLNHCHWNEEQLKKSISLYNIYTRPYLFKQLQRFCRCLSYQKQLQIKEVAEHYKYEYQIYAPSIINDALEYVSPAIRNKAECNLFELVDYVFSEPETYNLSGEKIEHEVNTNSANDIISLYKWLNSEDSFKDYRLLKRLYPLVCQKIQLQIIKRYFHDIRLKNTTFDVKVIEQFRNNDYDEFIRYRYCINTPDCNVNIGNQLLCDCILTLHETHGKSLLSFNGVLDFIIAHCDVTKPRIDLGLTRFLPSCNGGTIFIKKN